MQHPHFIDADGTALSLTGASAAQQAVKFTTTHGVRVCPTMSFDERGYRPNRKVYYLLGYGADGQAPAAFYPTVEEFIGEGGSFTHPRAVLENRPGVPAGACRAGREAMGAFRFAPLTLARRLTANR